MVSDVKVLEKEYPCLAAVNRCANSRRTYFVLSLINVTQIFTTFLKKDYLLTVSSSHRCTSSPGQSNQAAVLWRGTYPKDTHVGGKGEQKSLPNTKCQRDSYRTSNMFELIWLFQMIIIIIITFHKQMRLLNLSRAAIIGQLAENYSATIPLYQSETETFLQQSLFPAY